MDEIIDYQRRRCYYVRFRKFFYIMSAVKMEGISISNNGIVFKYHKTFNPIQISRTRKRKQISTDVSVNKYRCIGITLLVEDYKFSNPISEDNNTQYTNMKIVSKLELQVRVPVTGEDRYLEKSKELILRRDLFPKLTTLPERFKRELEDWARLHYPPSSNVKFAFIETPQGIICRNIQRTNQLRRQFERSIYFDENYSLKFNRKISQIREESMNLIQIILSKIKSYRDQRLACENEILNIEERFRAIYTSGDIQQEKNNNLELASNKNQMNCSINDMEKRSSISKSDIQRNENKQIELPSTTNQIKIFRIKDTEKRSSFSLGSDIRREDKEQDFVPITEQLNFSGKERVANEKTTIKKRTRRMETFFADCNIQNEIIDLELPIITKQMEERYNDIIHGEPFEIVVSKFNLSIKRTSIRTLIKLNWLDDEVINFYMNLIMERSELNANKLPSVYCMNTFFGTRFRQAGYSAVKRWTRKIDLFTKDIIVAPIHITNNHWIMVIIHIKNKTIFCYDSLGRNNQLLLLKLEKYLQLESLDKRKIIFDTSKFLIKKASNAPRQRNDSDCGVFSCMVAEYITRNQMPTFSQEHIPYFRKKMVLEICESKLWLL